MVLLLKKVVALATREGRNEGGYFATLWKRRISIVARTAMITQAHYALRKQDQDDMSTSEYDDRMFMLSLRILSTTIRLGTQDVTQLVGYPLD